MHRTKKLALMVFALPVFMVPARTPGERLSLEPHRTAQARLALAHDGTLSVRESADTERLVIRSFDGRIIRRLPAVRESERIPVWSPDGKSIVFQVRDSG